MKFGIFLAPFHRLGENPTLALDRDMELIFSPNVEAIRRAYTDAGREIPAEYRQRTAGARDLDPPATTTTP
jgi:hypothetical protein